MTAMTAPATVVIPAHGGHDPEEMNDRRAEWGEDMIHAIEACTGTDRHDALSDGLSDLMHWAHREGFDFAKELERATEHFAEETSNECR